MTTSFLSLGSNLGDKNAHMVRAVRLLAADPGIRVLRNSSLYHTDPVGPPGQDAFLNAVVEIETSHSPRALLDRCLAIENKLGRVRTVRWGPRTMDLDILIYGDLRVNEPGLEIPHAHLAERPFVLLPLAEIAPTGVVSAIVPGESLSAGAAAPASGIRRVEKWTPFASDE